MWEVRLTARARKALARLDRKAAQRVRDGLTRLSGMEDPTDPCKALTGPLAGLWRYRIGDYRVILDIRRNEVVSVALDLGHRSEIYD